MSRQKIGPSDDAQAIADSLDSVARALDQLGFGKLFDGTSGPGAFEGHTMMLRDEIVPALCNAIRDGFGEIADAIRERK